MERMWYRQDRAVVEAALRQGERPDLATPLGAGLLDELVALHEEVGILGAVDELAVTRQRAGIDNEPLLRTLAVLPFLPEGSLSGATEVLFREPALLLRLGWSPVEIRSGANRRHDSVPSFVGRPFSARARPRPLSGSDGPKTRPSGAPTHFGTESAASASRRAAGGVAALPS